MAGTLLVSLDFELFWGMLDQCPLKDYEDHVLGGRRAIPQLLELFRNYGIHATWATVGFQFAGCYEELASFLPEEEFRPGYEKQSLDPYGWFNKIGADEEKAPCFYAGSLLKKIADTPGQELGSHTFSHYYCREPGQTPAQFRADMAAARAIAGEKGCDVASVVLPRNQCEPEYTQVLRELGFAAYRDEENDWIHKKIHFRPLLRALRLLDVYLPLTGQGGYVPRNENGIWNLMGSRMYKPIFPALKGLEGLKIHRIKAQMRHAARKGLTFHLWWHPHNIGVRTQEHLAQLEEIFQYYQRLKEEFGMESLNMGEAARRAEQETAHG